MVQIGVFGLGPMGQNLTLNLLEHDYGVVVANRTEEITSKFLDQTTSPLLYGATSPQEFVLKLERPRIILLMVKAGSAVDATVEKLLPHLNPGDVLIDGGNSFFEDTNRREAMLESLGIHFLGAGISGGELGAKLGPSIMVGGAKEGWEIAKQILLAIAARNKAGKSCCAWLGRGGAGHYTKMVHNGIEYALMQLLAESYQILLAMNWPEARIAELFTSWNSGEAGSYLLELAVDVLVKLDPATAEPLLPKILDQAASKGTGAWTVNQGLTQLVACPAIAEAVFFRQLSTEVEGRRCAQALYPKKQNIPGEIEPQTLEGSLLAGMLLSFAQGFALLAKAREHYSWHLKLSEVAEIWQAGCIIRARLLERLDDLDAKPQLIFTEYCSHSLERNQEKLRQTVLWGVERELPIPTLASCLTYFDTYRTGRLPANLLSALRDHFGAHRYLRLDRPGDFHTSWREKDDH